MRKRITILADCPNGVTDAEIADFVKDAVSSWGGGFRPPGAESPDDPGDPFFDSLDVKEITVKKGRMSPNVIR